MSVAKSNGSARIEEDNPRLRWRNAPILDLERLVAGGPVIIVAPHPDDETLGCGGLISLASKAGIKVFIEVLTDGSMSHPNSTKFLPASIAAIRKEECRAACSLLGVASEAISFWDSKDGALECVQATVDRLRQRILAIEPSSIFVTWIDDPHSDHKAAFEIVRRAVASSVTPLHMYGYPIWSWRFPSDTNILEKECFRLDMMSEIDLKLQAFECHQSQLGKVVLDDPAGCMFSERDLARVRTMYESFIDVSI